MADAYQVLVVDDDANNLELLSRIVARSGYDVITADCGSSAIAQIVSKAPDLVLLDWMMPDLSGIDVLRAIRQGYDENALPVIMCTALAETEYVSSALKEGANEFLTKPVNPDVLSARISSQLSRKFAKQAIRAADEEIDAAVAGQTRKLLQMSSAPLKESELNSSELSSLLRIVHAVAEGDLTAVSEYQATAADLILAIAGAETDKRDLQSAY